MNENIQFESNCLSNNFDIFSRTVKIIDKTGLHARPATMIASIAKNAVSNVWIMNSDQKADAKSIISILMLACGFGSLITISVEDICDLPILDDIMAALQ